ncbi:MAG TPA: hypothetical protein VHZ29_00525 [Rhizomicrobium sp.]|jgi:hypothetical protein|nr:hypothetical protein [Rhizomicrobium sp.]
MIARQARGHPIALIAELAADFRESEEDPGLTPKERARLTRWRKHAAALEAYVRRQSGEGPAVPAIDVADTSDLPPELLKELSNVEADELETQIFAVLGGCGGSADLDQLLIGLFRKYGTVHKRRFLQNKLWRMVRKGDLDKADQRGLFRLAPPKPRKREKKRRR